MIILNIMPIHHVNNTQHTGHSSIVSVYEDDWSLHPGSYVSD